MNYITNSIFVLFLLLKFQHYKMAKFIIDPKVEILFTILKKGLNIAV